MQTKVTPPALQLPDRPEPSKTGNDTEMNTKGTKRKDPALVINNSSEEEDEEPHGGDLVNELMQRNSEIEQHNRELEMKLKAQELRLNLFARSQHLPQEELDSIILAAVIEDEQYRDARGEFIKLHPQARTDLLSLS